uniref:t-SNARE coiled-coil homology domain-containing protein n=1 Tax=Stomoxys calcitrans TaxID=35570 RepID=A0A1I8QC66_STOCA
MVKDRLHELREIQRNKSSDQPDEVDVGGDDDFIHIDMSVHRGPSFIEPITKKYAEIIKDFEGLESNIELLKSMLEARNATNFNEEEFNKVRQTNTQISNSIIGKFKKLESKLPKPTENRTRARMQRGLYYGYFQQYLIVWAQHEEVLQKYEQQLKKNLQMQSKILNYDLTDEEIDTLIEHKQTNLLMDNILNDSEVARQQLQDLKSRLNDLMKLEKSISEVHGLFIRLQTLVVEQGEVMQRIEKHFDDACDYVEQGIAHIKIAAVLNEKNYSLKRKLIIVGIVLLLLLILFTANSIKCFMFCKKK